MLYCYWITNPIPRSRYELPKWKFIFWWRELTSPTGTMPWGESGHIGFKRERANQNVNQNVFLEYFGILPFASFLGFCLRICKICLGAYGYDRGMMGDNVYIDKRSLFTIWSKKSVSDWAYACFISYFQFLVFFKNGQGVSGTRSSYKTAAGWTILGYLKLQFVMK